MTNFDLNPGGFVGAAVGAGIASLVVFCVLQAPEEGYNRGAKLFVPLIIGGAFAGNYLWSLAFKKPK